MKEPRKLSERISNAFQSCNGPDTLGRWVMGLGLVLALLDIFFYNPVFTVLYMACIFYAVYRLFSRKVDLRREENEKFEELLAKAKGRFARLGRGAAKPSKDDYLHIRCERCGQKLRVPKGGGHVRVTCPTCQHQTTMDS